MEKIYALLKEAQALALADEMDHLNDAPEMDDLVRAIRKAKIAAADLMDKEAGK